MLLKAISKIYSSFLSLLDTPSSYSGQGGKYVKVNTGETGLEFGAGRIEVLNAKLDFGCVADGVADDYTAMQNALNAASSGARIYFPSGIYYTTGVPTLQDKHNVFIYGDGRATVFKFAGSAGLKIAGTGPNGNYATYAYGNHVSGIVFDGITRGTNVGLELQWVFYTKVDNISGTKLDKVVYQKGSIRGIFSECFIYDFNGANFPNYWFYSDGGTNLAWEADNIYQSMQLQCLITHFYLKGTSSYPIDGININNVIMFFHDVASKLENIYIEYGFWLDIEGNKLFESGRDGCYFFNCDYITLTGNQVAFPGQKSLGNGFTVTGDGTAGYNENMVIDGNYIDKPSKHGIYISRSKRLIISDNPVKQPSNTTYLNVGQANVYDAINIDSVDHCTIDGLVVDQTSRTHAKDIRTVATYATCTYTNIYHPYSANVSLTGGGTLASGAITVSEIDGSPSYTSITTLQVPNASLTQPSAGIARLNLDLASFGIDGGAYSDTYISTANVDAGAY